MCRRASPHTQQLLHIPLPARQAKKAAYGWPVNRYRRVRDWAPDGWLDGTEDWPAEEARALILDEAAAMSDGVDRQVLAKKLGWR